MDDIKPKKSWYECVDTPDNDSVDGTPLLKNSQAYSAAVILGILSFFTLSGGRPGIFVAPHLLMSGWTEKDIGFALFVGGITALCVQAPIGQLIDCTNNKRIFILTANFLIAITSIVLIFDTDFAVGMICLCIQGVGNAMAMPALYGLTLGLVGTEGIIAQIPINETCNHAGNAFYAILGGALAFMAHGNAVFWIVGVMGIIGSFCLLLVNGKLVDHDRARGLVTSTSGDKTKKYTPIPLLEILRDTRILILLVSISLFHLGNAAMLPLLSQQLSLHNQKQGLAFAAACIIVAQVCMVFSAASCAKLIPLYGTKKLFVLGFGCIPIRGAIIIILLKMYPNAYILLTTQILDGVAGGIFGVTAVIVAEDLTRGSGRFNLIIGLIKTVEALGASFSNLIGEIIAHYSGYDSAFLFLCLVGFLPMLLYIKFMPDTSRPTDVLDVSLQSEKKLEEGPMNYLKSDSIPNA